MAKNPWTEEEVRLLKKFYPEKGTDIPELERSKNAIRHKANRLGIECERDRADYHPDAWTEEEKDFIRENRRRMTIREMASELGRSRSSVADMITRLGVGYSCPEPWSDEELEILRREYPEKGSEIPELKNRSREAIHQKASKMGLETKKDGRSKPKGATKEQVRKSKEIDKLVPKMKELKEQGLSFAEVADELGVSSSAVYKRIGGSCPKCDSWNKREDGWSDEDVELLREEYPEKGTKIPSLLERGYTRTAIKRKAQKEGITTKEELVKGRKKWTGEELELLRKYYPEKGTNIPQLAHRSDRAILDKANREGLAGTKVGPIAPLRGERHPSFGKKPSKETMKKMLDIRKPTSPEKRVMEIIESWGFPYRYAGDGQVVIGGLNPDFIDTDGSKKLIEVFGDHWHTGDVPYHRTEEGRRERFSEYGFDLLVLWESEMKELSDAEIAERIRRFGNGQKGA